MTDNEKQIIETAKIVTKASREYAEKLEEACYKIAHEKELYMHPSVMLGALTMFAAEQIAKTVIASWQTHKEHKNIFLPHVKSVEEVSISTIDLFLKLYNDSMLQIVRILNDEQTKETSPSMH